LIVVDIAPDQVVASLVDGCLVLRHIQHRHILQALGVYSNEQEPVMVLLARTTFGTLKQFLDDIRLQGGPQSSYGKVCSVCVCVCAYVRACVCVCVCVKCKVCV